MNQPNTENRPGITWRVFVGFDGSQARNLAAEMCDSLARRSRPDIEFDLQMCDFNSIGDAELRRQAIENAAAARIVVFASGARHNLTQPVLEWMEALSKNRRSREGVLVGLVCGNAPAERRETIESQLRQLAHRIGWDFLTHEPDCRSLNVQEAPEWVEARAGKMGPVLEGILNLSNAPVQMQPDRS